VSRGRRPTRALFAVAWAELNGSTTKLARRFRLGPATVRALAAERGLRRDPRLTLRAAARLTGTPPSTLERALRRGDVRGAQLAPGGNWLIEPDELRAGLADGRKGRAEAGYLTLAEASARWHYSVGALRVRCQRGWPGAKRGNRGHWLVPENGEAAS